MVPALYFQVTKYPENEPFFVENIDINNFFSNEKDLRRVKIHLKCKVAEGRIQSTR